MTEPSDYARVLAALARAGTRGITRVDFAAPDVIDGGKPIMNIPARIYDLKQDGVLIVKDGRRNRCSVYKLASSTGEGSAVVAGHAPATSSSITGAETPPATADTLFPVAPSVPRSALLDDEDAAA